MTVCQKHRFDNPDKSRTDLLRQYLQTMFVTAETSAKEKFWRALTCCSKPNMTWDPRTADKIVPIRSVSFLFSELVTKYAKSLTCIGGIQIATQTRKCVVHLGVGTSGALFCLEPYRHTMSSTNDSSPLNHPLTLLLRRQCVVSGNSKCGLLWGLKATFCNLGTTVYNCLHLWRFGPHM